MQFQGEVQSFGISFRCNTKRNIIFTTIQSKKSKKWFSHMIMSFRSFNDFKFNVLLFKLYSFVFVCNDQCEPILQLGAWWWDISVFCKSLPLHAFLNNYLVNLHFNFLLSMHVCIFTLTLKFVFSAWLLEKKIQTNLQYFIT